MHLPQIFNPLHDNRINGLSRMWILPVGALHNPFMNVKTGRARAERQRIAVEDVDDECDVAVGRELVGHQLAVLPDADHVRQEEDAGASVGFVGGRLGEVGVIGADFDQLAGGGAPGQELVVIVLDERMAITEG